MIANSFSKLLLITTKLLLFSVVLILSFNCKHSTQSDPKEYTDIELEIIELASTIIHFEDATNILTESDTNWKTATYFTGLIELYHSSHYPFFYEKTYAWAEFNKWKIGPRLFHADDQLSAYVYLRLYEEYPSPFIVEHLRKNFALQINDTTSVWWWADALFMAPPALQLSEKIGLLRTDSYNHSQWKKTEQLLFSTTDSLFYRDKRYNNHLDENKEKQFWLRGNGWVLAGLALQLSHMEKQHDHYEYYLSIFQKMASKLNDLTLQHNLWNMNLLKPEKFPYAETSGSALICYGITKGVTQNWLDSNLFEHQINSCYQELISNISIDGKVESVQPVNAKPEAFDVSNSEPFGSGAVLLFLAGYYDYISTN